MSLRLVHQKYLLLFISIYLPILANLKHKLTQKEGSGCGSVGRAVASDTRDLRFETSHWQDFIMNIFTVTVEKTKIKKKEAGNSPIK